MQAWPPLCAALDTLFNDIRARCEQLGGDAAERALTFHGFLRFYVPLAMTSLLYLLVQPIGSAALSRMPNALESLAVWPVVYGLILVLRSVGIAYTEVVVALLDEPRAMVQLRRFAVLLTALTTGVMLIMVATPLAMFWFQRVSALAPRLATLAQWGLWIALPLPGLTVLQSWYQGIIVHSSRTRGITEAMVIFLLVSCAILWGGVVWAKVPGLYVGLVAFTTAVLLQTAWLWQRSRSAQPTG